MAFREHSRAWETSSPSPSASRKPVGTYGLLAAMAVVFVAELLVRELFPATLAAATDNATTVYYYQGAVTYQGGTYDWFSLLFPINTDWTVRPWSLVTSTFSHSPTNLNHLLFNGLTLWFFAPTIERLVGTRRLILLFLAGGAASGLAQVYLEQTIGGTGGALGASGAIMLLLGILILLFPRQRVALFGIVPVPLWGLGIGYAALDVLGALNPGDGIANFAHLAGLAMGLGYGVYFKQDLKRRGMKWVSR